MRISSSCRYYQGNVRIVERFQDGCVVSLIPLSRIRETTQPSWNFVSSTHANLSLSCSLSVNGRLRLGPAPGEMAAGQDAIQCLGPERARTPDGSKAGGGVAVSRQYLLAPRRPGRPGAIQVDAGSETPAIAHDSRQPVRSDR